MDAESGRPDPHQERKNMFGEFGQKPELMAMNMVDEWVRSVWGEYKETS